MRLFIAIRLSCEMKRALLACMRDLKKQGVKGKFVPEENLHLTLAFIGEYDDPTYVKRVIDSIPAPRFGLGLSGCGSFGELLWAGIKENKELESYAEGLRAALKAADIPFDRKRFIPHITLVRKVKTKNTYDVHLSEAGMTVTKAALMESVMKKGKVEYREWGGCRKKEFNGRGE